jgi:uncharacterized protein (DUF1778 family)
MAEQPLKNTRWNVRVPADLDETVREAASVSHQNLSEFVLQAAAAEANRVLGDQTRFVLDRDEWNRFVDFLDRPPKQDYPGLDRLFSKPSIFS